MIEYEPLQRGGAGRASSMIMNDCVEGDEPETKQHRI